MGDARSTGGVWLDLLRALFSAVDDYFHAVRHLQPACVLPMPATLVTTGISARQPLRIGIFFFRPVEITRAQWAGLPSPRSSDDGKRLP